ncbi:type IVB secretion system protein IcmH/DotU [Pseudomonas sp. BT-42-2]|uniref:type IVB secretion system protein IcmH/DotU n=1 Tax=Pseudomonas sp. BT-42-2 TaxID=2986927 RepID=UPI0021F6D90B|nr:type IVB secretion system protein IcmH/DotU [Pseudomonas sp. BT-42-2]MCV9920359.1 type IVB secretion system protein IcmH/DotU [Pseudomonas sp. BT-42-2]
MTDKHNTPGAIDTELHGLLEQPHSAASRSEAPADYPGYPADPQFQLRGAFSNLMIDAAMPLFGLAMRLQTLDDHQDIKQLYKDVHNQITCVLAELRQHNYEPAHLLAYSYSLCLYLDETVMSTPWGKNSSWSQQPLLSDFHQETWGGEKFFTVLSRMMLEPQRYQQVLEFMYLCLCMGLKGKYAILPKGDEALQSLIVKLHRQIRELRGPVPEYLSDPLTNVAPRNFRMNRQWPWWSPLVISAVALAALYAFYSYRLHVITTEVLQSLNRILQ